MKREILSYEVQVANRAGVFFYFLVQHPNLFGFGMSTLLIMCVYLLPRCKMLDQNHMAFKENDTVTMSALLL